MKTTNKIYITAAELSVMLGVSVGHAYKIIRQLNQELRIFRAAFDSETVLV